MINFIQNLLPRLLKFSQSLDQTELFVDKPWVLIDENGQQQTYIFRRSGELLMSLDGQVQIGTWDYIAPAQSLLIDRKIDRLLLNHLFFTDALLVLARDGQPESKFILANRQLIPDLDVENYLRLLGTEQSMHLKNHTLLSSPILRFSTKTSSGFLLEFLTKTGTITIGDATFIESKPAQDGRYVSEKEWGVIVKDGLVKSIFWSKIYQLKTANKIIVDCRNKEISPQINDRIFTFSGVPLEDGKYNIIDVGKIRVLNGLVASFPFF